MSDKRIDIRQEANDSNHVTMIGYQQIVNQYGSDAPRIRDYLTDVVDKFGPLRKRYIDLEGSAPQPRRSDDPFADLFLITPVMRLEGREEPVPSVQAALQERDRLVMLGDPGAGKTTSLKVLLANAAERCLKDAETHPLPLLLELGAWPDSVPDLSAYVERHLKASLPMGSKLLLLLDGLNEIGGEHRIAKIDSIRAYLDGFKLARVVMTCREKDYPKELDAQFGLPKLTVAPLDDARVHRLIHAYLPDEAQAEALWQAIQPTDSFSWARERALLELARNPYLLTILTWIYWQSGNLPESPAQLFRQMVELRYQHESRRGRPPFTFEQFTRLLGDLAFEMIDQGKGTSAKKAWVRRRAGKQTSTLVRFGEACNILVDNGDNVSFFHQLMQEYFAACALGWRGDTVVLAKAYGRWHETLRIRLTMSREARDQVLGVHIAALKDENWRMRRTAVWTLGEIKDARAVEPLLAIVKDEDEALRLIAVRALGKIEDTRAVEPLIASLKDKVQNVRRAAAKALGEIKDARAVEPLLAALEDEEAGVRWNAVEALGQIKDARAVEPLIATLEDEEADMRWSAAEALGEIRDVRAVKPLIAALEDEDKVVRYDAAWALGKIKDARAVPGLIKRLMDTEKYSMRSEERICDTAATALRMIGTPEALAALREHGFEVEE